MKNISNAVAVLISDFKRLSKRRILIKASIFLLVYLLALFLAVFTFPWLGPAAFVFLFISYLFIGFINYLPGRILYMIFILISSIFYFYLKLRHVPMPTGMAAERELIKMLIISIPFTVSGFVIAHFRDRTITAADDIVRMRDTENKTFSSLIESYELSTRYEFIINSVRLFMTLVNRELVYEALNRSFCKALSIRPKDVIGRQVREVWDQMDHGAKLEKRLKTAIKGKVINFQELIDLPFQGLRFFEITLYPFPNNENVSHVVMVYNDITERQKDIDDLRKTVIEKDVLLQEVHHRVKNNLQFVSSMLYFQSRMIKDADTREVFLSNQKRIKLMSVIHENLYQTGDLANVNFEDYGKNLLESISRMYPMDNPVSITSELEDICLEVDIAVPIGIILNELTVNALKHAFIGQDRPKIEVTLISKAKDRALLTVRDNGMGLAEDIDPENSESLGLNLVSTMVSQLDGSLKVDTGNGTAFIIEFRTTRKKK